MRWAERLGRRALVGDGLLAVALAGMALATAIGAQRWQDARHPIDALGGALIVGAALPLVVRRAWPLATLMLTAAATSAYLILGYPYALILLCLAVAVYTAAARLPARRATLGGVVALVMLLGHVLVLATGPGRGSALAGLVPGSAWVFLPFAVGRVVRVGRESSARTRAEQIRRQSYEERLRIAQEVHDVVGHGLAAIHMQAEIALHVLPKRPEHAETALTAISRTSKEALDELRATLAVVRREDHTAASRAPGSGLARVGELVERMSGTGVAVTVATTGTPRELPAAVDLAAYRIVQEALTNVLRHADTTTASVLIGYQPPELTIEVTDNGRGAGRRPGATAGDAHGGQGIPGMAARVTALGGVFEAGPRPGGGFRVHARLPIAQAPA
ncbi:sensor histidine kinase [Dactylosporangium sp. CA-233914]|uniref:sensor histidine kinase n=1 Tax=Dactylosporangium sp. CA-233914 TaxID=3239934 RepID=UPI003D941943